VPDVAVSRLLALVSPAAAPAWEGAPVATPNQTLSLLEAGPKDPGSGIRGWFFKWGSTGLCPLGGGLFYMPHNSKAKYGQQQSVIYKYKRVGNDQNAFVLVK
jgi:hypothetical protein